MDREGLRCFSTPDGRGYLHLPSSFNTYPYHHYHDTFPNPYSNPHSHHYHPYAYSYPDGNSNPHPYSHHYYSLTYTVQAEGNHGKREGSDFHPAD